MVWFWFWFLETIWFWFGYCFQKPFGYCLVLVWFFGRPPFLPFSFSLSALSRHSLVFSSSVAGYPHTIRFWGFSAFHQKRLWVPWSSISSVVAPQRMSHSLSVHFRQCVISPWFSSFAQTQRSLNHVACCRVVAVQNSFSWMRLTFVVK